MSESSADNVSEAKKELKRFMGEICGILKTVAKKPDTIPADYELFGSELDKQIEAAFDELHIDQEGGNASRLNTILEAIDKLELPELQSVGLSGANLKVKMSAWDKLKRGWDKLKSKAGTAGRWIGKKLKDLADSILGSLGKILIPIAPVIDAIEEFKHVYTGTRKAIEPSGTE